MSGKYSDNIPVVDAIPLDTPIQGLSLNYIDFIQLYPVFIAAFMVMSSLFNGPRL